MSTMPRSVSAMPKSGQCYLGQVISVTQSGCGVCCSKVFHSLVELALQTGSSTDPDSRDEAWGYYVDVTDIVQHRAQVMSL